MTDLMPHLVPWLVAIPLGTAFLLPLVGRVFPRRVDALGPATLGLLLLLCLPLQGHDLICHLGGWPTPIGIDLRVDALTWLMLLTINGVAAVVGLYSIDYLGRFTSRDRFYALFLFMVAGMNGVVLTGDLFNLYVFMEIAVIASYALVAFGGEHEELEASFKYAVLGSLSSAFILIGIGLVYGVTGTLNFSHLALRVQDLGMTPPLQFALALFFCGFGLKAALAPFHAWLPDAHPAAPAPISAMLSGVLIKAVGLYVLARLVFNVFGATESMLLLFRWVGGMTMVVGGLLALGQWDIKRLFAYSSIGQAGTILLALGWGTTWGAVGALYHLVNHAAFKSLLFLNSGLVEDVAGTRDLRRMSGLAKALPVTRVTSLAGSLALAGIPPFNGFWSKLIIVMAGIEAGRPGWAALVVGMSMVSLAYQLKMQQQAFAAPSEDGPQPVREPRAMAAAMIVLAVSCLGLSLLAVAGLKRPLAVGPAAEVLIKGPWTM